jgi:hypothetical protein
MLKRHEAANYIIEDHSSNGQLNINEQAILMKPKYKMFPPIRTLNQNIYDFTLGL